MVPISVGFKSPITIGSRKAPTIGKMNDDLISARAEGLMEWVRFIAGESGSNFMPVLYDSSILVSRKIPQTD